MSCEPRTWPCAWYCGLGYDHRFINKQMCALEIPPTRIKNLTGLEVLAAGISEA